MYWLLAIYILVSTWEICSYVWEKSDGVTQMSTDKHLVNAVIMTFLWPLFLYAMLIILPFALLKDFRERKKK